MNYADKCINILFTLMPAIVFSTFITGLLIMTINFQVGLGMATGSMLSFFTILMIRDKFTKSIQKIKKVTK